MMKIISLMFLVAIQSTQLLAAGDPDDPGIHPVITGRDFVTILQLHNKGELKTDLGRRVVPYEHLTTEIRSAVHSCNSSILSLGEGRSSFIYQLLSERQFYLQFPFRSNSPQNECGISNIQALDVSYPQHDSSGKITDRRQPDSGTEAGLEKYDALMVKTIQQYPLNYHSQLFQEMDLKDERGVRRQFSLIVSTYALSYVLLAYVKTDEMKVMLERVLQHLKPGGVLMMLPMIPIDGPEERKQVDEYFAFLNLLRQRKEITDFTVPPLDANEKKTPMLIIK